MGVVSNVSVGSPLLLPPAPLLLPPAPLLPPPAPLLPPPAPLLPAPLGSAVGIAAIPFSHEAKAKIVSQKGTLDSQVYIDANNNVVRVVHKESPDCLTCEINRGTATLTNDALPAGGFTMFPGGGKVYWGRWQKGWHGQDTYGSGPGEGSWHFMYSPDVTSQASLDFLEINNVVATFDMWSANDGTKPTDELGNIGTYATTPTMSVDFGAKQITGYTVGVDFAATGRSFVGTQGAAVPFFGPGVEIPLNVSCNPSCSVATGSGTSSVLFVGNSASHAINSYEMHTDDGANAAVGTALLTRTPQPPP